MYIIYNIYIFIHMCMSTYTYTDKTFKVMFSFDQFSDCWDYLVNKSRNRICSQLNNNFHNLEKYTFTK